MRLKELRLAKGLYARELGSKVGLHEADISKLEHYHFLPTPKTMDLLCEVLEVQPLDIYCENEMTLFKPNTTAKKKMGERECPVYNLHVILPKSWKEPFQKSVKALGWQSIHDWLIEEIEKLIGGQQK